MSAATKSKNEMHELIGRLYEEFCLVGYLRNYSTYPTPQELLRWKKKHKDVFVFPAIQARVSSYYSDNKNMWQTELVCLYAIRLGSAVFEPVQHLGPINLDFIKRSLGIPKGAWQQALWVDQQRSSELVQIQNSGYYWLDLWADSLAIDDQAGVDLAKKMLGKLMLFATNEEVLEEYII